MSRLETIEWVDLWFDNAPEADNRVMFIGDSINRGYRPKIKEKLGGKYCIDQLSTSRGIDNPDLQEEIIHFLKNYEYTKIQFTNCLHGWHVSDDDYAIYYDKTISLIKKAQPAAEIYIALGTPRTMKEGRDEGVLRRNRAASLIAEKHNARIIDLYSVAENREDLKRDDGVHFLPEGYELLADAVISAMNLKI